MADKRIGQQPIRFNPSEQAQAREERLLTNATAKNSSEVTRTNSVKSLPDRLPSQKDPQAETGIRKLLRTFSVRKSSNVDLVNTKLKNEIKNLKIKDFLLPTKKYNTDQLLNQILTAVVPSIFDSIINPSSSTTAGKEADKLSVDFILCQHYANLVANETNQLIQKNVDKLSSGKLTETERNKLKDILQNKNNLKEMQSNVLNAVFNDHVYDTIVMPIVEKMHARSAIKVNGEAIQGDDLSPYKRGPELNSTYLSGVLKSGLVDGAKIFTDPKLQEIIDASVTKDMSPADAKILKNKLTETWNTSMLFNLDSVLKKQFPEQMKLFLMPVQSTSIKPDQSQPIDSTLLSVAALNQINTFIENKMSETTEAVPPQAEQQRGASKPKF